MAYTFGVGPLIDAFVLAMILPSLVVQFASGAFAQALIPVVIEKRESGDDEAADRLTQNLVFLALAASVTAMALLIIAAPVYIPLMASGFPADTLALTVRLAQWLAPLVILQGVLTIWGGIVHADQRFAAVATIPVVRPLFAIGALFAFGDRFGVEVLVFAVLAGAAVEIGLTLTVLRRLGRPAMPCWTGRDAALTKTLRLYWPMLGGMIVFTGNLFVDQIMAASLDPGAVSVIAYGNKVMVVVLALSALPLSKAVLPIVARQATSGNHGTIARSLVFWSIGLVGVTAPAAGMLFAFADTIIATLFERGAFSVADTALVGSVLAFYALQLPMALLASLNIGVLSAYQKGRAVFWTSLVGFGANIVLNIVLMPVFGVAGIAIATTLVQALTVVLSGAILIAVLRSASRSNTTNSETAS